MRLLAMAAGSDWMPCIAPAGSDEAARVQADGTRKILEQLLREILLSEHLLILAGLGTTLCLKSSSGQSIAPTMKELWAAARDKAGSGFDFIKRKVRYTNNEENIELLLSHCQVAQTLESTNEVDRFIKETEALIIGRCRFVDENSSMDTHEAFLRKVARRSTRQPRLKLFTTNYDLCFETAASRTRFVVVDGFSHTQPQEFDGSYFGYDLVRRGQDRDIPDYLPNVFHLYKIHGSVDWELRGARVMRTVNPERPLIIYPRHTKFESSYDQPFIEMMSRFQIALRQPNSGGLVIGFGFNDPHIFRPLMSAVRSNVNLKAMVVDPEVAGSDKEAIRELRALIAAGDQRLSLVEAKFEELVPVLPDLVAVTEEERHHERIRGLGGVA